jgi:hypothetical protein
MHFEVGADLLLGKVRRRRKPSPRLDEQGVAQHLPDRLLGLGLVELFCRASWAELDIDDLLEQLAPTLGRLVA